MRLSSPTFSDGESIPDKHGYETENTNPPLEIGEVPADAVSLALVLDDPDAQEPAGKIWDHWVVWNIDTDTSRIEEGSTPTGATEGRNDFGEIGYGGPRPPDREHTYHFRLYALDTDLGLDSGARKRTSARHWKRILSTRPSCEGHTRRTKRLRRPWLRLQRQ